MPRDLRIRKLLVEIIFPSGDTLKVKRKVEGDHIIIEDSSRGKTGWKPQFDRDCILNEGRGRLIKSFRRKVQVKYGAEKCIKFSPEKDALDDMPPADRKTIQRLFDAQVLQNAGRSILKVSVPLPVYLLLLVILILTLFGLLSGSGFSFR